MSTATKILTFEEAREIYLGLSFNIKHIWKKCATEKLIEEGYESIGSSDISGTALLLIIEHNAELGSLIDEFSTYKEEV